MISVIKENTDNTVKKIMGLYKTRWVERFEAHEKFVGMALVIVNICEFIFYPHMYEDDKFEVLKKRLELGQRNKIAGTRLIM